MARGDGCVFKRVGVLGGGQLGRMLGYAAQKLGIELLVVDPEGQNCPAAASACEVIEGDFKHEAAIIQLANKCDVLTTEIEHVDAQALSRLLSGEEGGGKRRAEADLRELSIHPAPETLRLIQDKLDQKLFFARHQLPSVDSEGIIEEGQNSGTSSAKFLAIERLATQWGYPIMLKTRRLAYDGRGNAVIRNREEIQHAIDLLESKGELYAEKWVPFVKELAVMVVKNEDDSLMSYPVVETIQVDSICQLVIAPAQVSHVAKERAKSIAESAVRKLQGSGIFGVELFLLSDDTILLNEIAPRPHNSGHYTLDACVTDQFEQHLRAILNLPLGSPEMKMSFAVMYNVLGIGDSWQKTFEPCARALSLVPSAKIHWYGKKQVRHRRKMGHITIVGNSLDKIMLDLESILGTDYLDQILRPSKICYANFSSMTKDMSQVGVSSPIVGIIMGSDSDLSIMKEAANILEEFRVPFELTIVSAHRTPDRMFSYARSSVERGLRVLIAGAGGAAHLPGMVASLTCLPVIGVPIALKHLDGKDSLLSICQMPKGIPVATVAIDNATNAALLAIRILASSTPSLMKKLLAYQDCLRDSVMQKVAKLDDLGWNRYTSLKS